MVRLQAGSFALRGRRSLSDGLRCRGQLLPFIGYCLR